MDQLQLRFDPSSLTLLNVILGLVMFGVALDLKVEQFRQLARSPKAPAVGLVAQFLVLPAITFVLTRLLNVQPSVALGMILVSCCPGGNVSNFITHLAGGATSTSVGMTAVSTAAAVVMTPLNFSFWAGLNPGTAGLLRQVSMNPAEMFGTVAVLLGIPVVAGMTLAAHLPGVAAVLRRPFRYLSVTFFVGFVVVAFHANFDHFLRVIGMVFFPVALMNALAFVTGWGSALALGLERPDRKAVAVEVGIQNSGLALILVFDFFDGLGGMAVVAAWWGIWHLIAGLTLATVWSRWD